MRIKRSFIYKLLRLIGHQDWLRYGIRSRLIRCFCDPDTTDSYEFEIDFFGFRYKGNLDCYLDWVVYFFGAYEKYELFLFREILKDKVKPVFIDIGANIGQHALFMSRYCGYVHAFEPYEPVRRKLDSRIQDNGIRNIIVHGVGLGDKDCELDYFAPKGHNTGLGSFVSTHESGKIKLFGKLKVFNADNYISKLGIGRIDLIKIDVEGFEKNVLIGLRNTLIKYRPFVFMEFSTETANGLKEEKEILSMLPNNYSVRMVKTENSCCLFFNRASYKFINFNSNISNYSLWLSPCS